MNKEAKAKVLLVRVPKEKIGLFTALMDGSGRKAIVRTKERSSDEIYLIATPDTFGELFPMLDNLRKHMPEIQIVGEVEGVDVG